MKELWILLDVHWTEAGALRSKWRNQADGEVKVYEWEL